MADTLRAALASANWVEIGDRASTSIVYDPDPLNVGNYKSLVVKPWPDGRWRAEVNGSFRGWAASRSAARRIAVLFARSQFTETETLP